MNESECKRQGGITEEMIQKGVNYLQESGRLSFESRELDKELVVGLLEHIYLDTLQK